MVICELPEREFKINALKKFDEIPEGTVNLMNIEKQFINNASLRKREK